MSTERKQRVWRTVKTALLALVITAVLFLTVYGKKDSSVSYNSETRELRQKIAKLEKSLQDNREMFDETREVNRTLLEILSELRGIHNDCQRNATENFLREHRNQDAR